MKHLCVAAHQGDTARGWDGESHALGGYLDPLSGYVPDLPRVAPETEVVAYCSSGGDIWEDTTTAPATAMWLAAQLDRPIPECSA